MTTKKAVRSLTPAAPRIDTTLGALVEGAEALRRLVALPLGMAPSYHLSKLVRLIEIELAIFNERRESLVKELGQPLDGQSDSFRVPPEQARAFGARLKELCEIPVAVPWGPFDLSALGADHKITAADLLALRVDEPGALVTMPTPAETLAEKSI